MWAARPCDRFIFSCFIFFYFSIYSFPRLPRKSYLKNAGGGVSGYDSAERSAKGRGHAPFLWGKSKKGFVWGISQPQNMKRNTRGSTIGCAGKGYPPVQHLLHMVSSGEGMSFEREYGASFFFLSFFGVLGSPRLLIYFPRNLPLECFLESPSRRCMDSLCTLRHAVLSLGSTERGEDTSAHWACSRPPSDRCRIWGYGDPVFQC